MFPSRSALQRILFIALLAFMLNIGSGTGAQSAAVHATGVESLRFPLPQLKDWPRIRVRLSAPRSTISWDERDSQRNTFELPLLYLHHERDATAAGQRTLDIEVTGLAGGAALQLEAVSRHANAYTGEPHILRKRFTLPDRLCSAVDPCRLRWTFDPATALSDLYNLRARSDAGELLWSSPGPGRPDFVLLDTWDVSVGADRAEQAGGYSVRVTYAVLFPFARDTKRMDYRLPPEAVPGFIEHIFVPMIEDTWQTQLGEWGLGDSMHPEWDADKVVDVIITAPPYALFDGTGTYTVFSGSERRIWWLSTHPAFGRYDSWENAHRTIFAHEFFHLAQWNALLSAAQATDRHPARYWLNTFIEAQAEFAVGVQYPELELGKDHVLAGSSAYGNSANLFLVDRLNVSYGELEAQATSKYDLALYWRFLYEQFDDMRVVRAALEEMVRADDDDIVESIRNVMTQAFGRLDGPFRTYEESLIAFARANYALRLENGRCAVPDFAVCGGRYYDPDERYVEPTLEAELTYEGTALAYKGAIPASYGMDFIEVDLSPAVNGQPLTIGLQAEEAEARFDLQVWKLKSGDVRGVKPRAISPQPEVVLPKIDGSHRYVIPNVDTTVYDRLALVITRLDAAEKEDAVGHYTVTLER
jgi:hypothetical protein